MNKPDIKELKQLYSDIVEGNTNYTKAGKHYGVSDNAVRKRFKTSGRILPKKIQGTKTYICSLCNKTFIDDVSRQKDSKSGMHFCNTDCLHEYARNNKEFNMTSKYIS